MILLCCNGLAAGAACLRNALSYHASVSWYYLLMNSGDSFTHHAQIIMRYVPFNCVFTYSVKLQACYVA